MCFLFPKGREKVRMFGKIFLGKDEITYGKEGIGWVDYDPDYECGGPIGSPGRLCPFTLEEEEEKKVDGRLLHVSLASYRDPLCPNTLFNMFRKAKNPKDIRVYVLQQNDASNDLDCLETYCHLMRKEDRQQQQSVDDGSCPYKDQIFVHSVDYREALGPMWARGLLSKDLETAHINGTLHTQDFCMSTDAHMDYELHWDEEMQSMFEQAQNEYAVLTTYVTSTTELGKFKGQVPHLCMVTFTSNVRNHATKCANNLSKPKLTNAMFGAGLSYAKCHAELKVPVDPHSEHIFDGEEFNRAARLWTHGYDMYTPNNVVVLHEYIKAQSNPTTRTWMSNSISQKKIEENQQQKIRHLGATQRLLTMIDVPGGVTDRNIALELKQSKYGLGDRRTLDQLIQFSGFDLRHRKPSIDGKNRCGNIQWVPFQQHPKGVNYIPQYDPNTEKPLDSFDNDVTSIWYKSGLTYPDVDKNTDTDAHTGLTNSNIVARKQKEDLPHLRHNLEQMHASLKQHHDGDDHTNTNPEYLQKKKKIVNKNLLKNDSNFIQKKKPTNRRGKNEKWDPSSGAMDETMFIDKKQVIELHNINLERNNLGIKISVGTSSILMFSGLSIILFFIVKYSKRRSNDRFGKKE